MIAWASIKGYEGLYEVSNFGTIKNLKSGKIWSDPYDRKVNQYKYFSLLKDGKRNQFAVHRLVAQAFIPFPDTHIIHLNKNKSDNRAANLSWCTHSENMMFWGVTTFRW